MAIQTYSFGIITGHLVNCLSSSL